MAATTNGDSAAAATAVLDNIKAPPGVVIPPPGEIREAIEKTAGYVVRGGVGLEQRIRENHGENPKFSFVMSASDPYNPYYEWRKQEIRDGRGTAVAAGRVGEAAAKPVKEEPKGPPKPPDFHFSARMPRMSQKDLEIVRLTALFVAKNGRPWMLQLHQREGVNPQFQFLVPNHTLHNFFQSMVDHYSAMLKESGVDGDGTKAREARFAELRENVDNKYHVLARTKLRAEYAKWQEAERLRKEEEEEKNKIEFARIDWGNFIVAETITFTEEDDQANLPAPANLNDLEYASLEEKNKMSISSNLRIEEAFPFEETNYNAYPPKTYGASLPTQPAQPSQPTQTLPIQPAPAANGSYQRNWSAQEEEENRRIKEREDARSRMHQAQTETRVVGHGPVKIKENYVPRAAARVTNNADTQMAICPNCKEKIPVNEMFEHMRIELLDPAWKEQRAKQDMRHASATLSGADIASNISKRFASQRPDVYDPVTGKPLTEEEQARLKRPTLGPFEPTLPPQPEAPVNPLQSLNVEEQIRAIHQKFAGTGENKS